MEEKMEELLEITPQTKEQLQLVRLQQQMLNFQLQVTLLNDLVEKLDPDHDYIYDQQKQAFIKKEKKDARRDSGIPGGDDGGPSDSPSGSDSIRETEQTTEETSGVPSETTKLSSFEDDGRGLRETS